MTTVTSISQFNYLTQLSAEAAKKNRKPYDVIRWKSTSPVLILNSSIMTVCTYCLPVRGTFDLPFHAKS